MDRTSELLALVGQGAPLAQTSTSSRSEFQKKASKIGQGIHSASIRLGKLSQLAKRTSMFDDPQAEIGELTVLIKQDITNLNRAIEDLQIFSANKNRDGSYNKQSSAHSSTVVDNLRTRLKDTTKEFKDVLTLRTENIKHNQNRRKIFSDSSSDASSMSMSAPLLPRQKNRPKMNSSSSAMPSSSSAHANPGGIGESMQQQLLQGPAEDSYMTSRADALKNVESTIVELGGIFEQLAHMVHEQGEMAVRIDENVDETVSNVESAQAQLMKYFKTISSNRWLIMKVFSVLLIFAVLFIIFVA